MLICIYIYIYLSIFYSFICSMFKHIYIYCIYMCVCVCMWLLVFSLRQPWSSCLDESQKSCTNAAAWRSRTFSVGLPQKFGPSSCCQTPLPTCRSVWKKHVWSTLGAHLSVSCDGGSQPKTSIAQYHCWCQCNKRRYCSIVIQIRTFRFLFNIKGSETCAISNCLDRIHGSLKFKIGKSKR